jgi:hypothetical protein
VSTHCRFTRAKGYKARDLVRRVSGNRSNSWIFKLFYARNCRQLNPMLTSCRRMNMARGSIYYTIKHCAIVVPLLRQLWARFVRKDCSEQHCENAKEFRPKLAPNANFIPISWYATTALTSSSGLYKHLAPEFDWYLNPIWSLLYANTSHLLMGVSHWWINLPLANGSSECEWEVLLTNAH